MDPVAVTAKTYDVIAPVYADRCRQPFPDLVADIAEFASQLPGGWVVDVGCGPGRDTQLLRDHGLGVVGVDLSAAMLTAGGLRGTVQGDMRALPLRSGCCAGVWCQAAMLHIPHAQVPQVLSEMARTCGSGGRLHLAVAEGDGQAFEPDAYGSGLGRFFAYHRSESLQELVTDAGFTVTTVERRTSHRHWLRLTAVRR